VTLPFVHSCVKNDNGDLGRGHVPLERRHLLAFPPERRSSPFVIHLTSDSTGSRERNIAAAIAALNRHRRLRNDLSASSNDLHCLIQ
jgi:hypothetical protein